jgi:hypothetical protein
MEITRPRTRTELQELRKLESRKHGKEFLEKWISSNPYMVEISNPGVFKNYQIETGYNPSPKIKTKTELEATRKKQALIENQMTVQTNCKTLSQRVDERDKNSILASPIRSIKSRLDERKKHNLKVFSQKFSIRPFGVHGEELPKFNDHLRDYWKLKEGYIENPSIKTTERPTSRPISEFSRLRVKSSSVDYEITSKPNNTNPFPNYNQTEFKITEKKTSSRSRFTDEVFLRSRPASQMSSNQFFSRKPAHSKNISGPEYPIDKNSAAYSAFTKSRPATAKISIRSSGFL